MLVSRGLKIKNRKKGNVAASTQFHKNEDWLQHCYTTYNYSYITTIHHYNTNNRIVNTIDNKVTIQSTDFFIVIYIL